MKKSLPEIPIEEGNTEAGFGALSTERGCLPLEALDMQVRLDGLVASVQLKQTFVNVHAEALEATYIFPLPDRAAVTRFRLEAGGRIVEGELKERKAARHEYEQAIQKGHRAAITEEERPGVFTMRVGNLPPGEMATVHLTLSGPLPYSDGEATFRFPLVVAPRYIPGTPLPGEPVGDGTAPDTDAVPDASRISPPVLLPGFPNPVRLSVSVEVPPSSLQPSDFRSSLHTILETEDNGTKRFRLQPGERLNRDFLLRFRIGQDHIVTSLSLQPDADGSEGTFLLTLVPPLPKQGQNAGRDVVFVLDRSGSMLGWKMVAARRALARMVDTLTEHDRFTVYAFDDCIETPSELGGSKLVWATDRLRFRTVEFLAKLDARGGTEMARPLDCAVNELSRAKESGRESILVLVTDGQVGNEDQILKHLGSRSNGIRIFTLGIDRAVNAAFLRRLADLGGGRSELVESEDRLDEVMASIHRHIGKPVLTGLRLEPAGLKFLPENVVPARLPDLFAGAPLIISGRYRGDAGGAIALQGRDEAGKAWSTEVRGQRVDNPALTTIWARGRLREMEDRYVIGGDKRALEREIVATSLRFGVLCRFTAFVAIDRSEVVNPDGQVHGIVQPVEQPEGWESDVVVSALMAFPGPPGAGDPKVETVDSMLNFDECEDDSACQTVRASDPSLRKRLLSSLSQKKRKQQPCGDAMEQSPYRQQAVDLLQSLQGSQAADASAKLAVLRNLSAKLDELHQKLISAKDRDPSVKTLGEALQRLHALLSATQPAETDILDVWTQIEKCLQHWLALSETTKSSRKEDFWK